MPSQSVAPVGGLEYSDICRLLSRKPARFSGTISAGIECVIGLFPE